MLQSRLDPRLSRHGLASDYLSQVERGEVNQPTPSTLKRLADAYEMLVTTFMEWAGYTVTQSPTSPQLARAMSAIGPDPSENEVAAIEAILKVLRDSAGFAEPHFLDRPLSPQDRKVIRDHAVVSPREADALGESPTDLDVVMSVAQLVYAGEIELTPEEHRGLFKRFGARRERALKHMQGLLTFRSQDIWLAPNLHPSRRRFVNAHEIGHHILPLHRELAYLDT